MSDKIFMYGDRETVDFLNKNSPKVILFGGYLGYNNFGDILQLKEAIKFHINVTILEPVVICHVASIPDDNFLSRLRTWFGVRAFIFLHDQSVDLAFLNLNLIDSFISIESLHVYGGGFLNRYWGNYFLKLIEGLIENFRVVNYVLSGQQLDTELSNRLKFHFAKYHPRLIGVRDIESQKLVNSIGFQSEFSFDDASNIIEAWARRKPEQGGTKEALFIHLNTSKYTYDNSAEHRKELHQITNILEMLANRFSRFDPVFLSAYSEYRIAVKDTLATIISMEDSLPFLNYSVLDIAHMALLHDPYSTTADNNLVFFLGGGIAISSSYHTAMFCNMLETPCYLLSSNAYYKQKQEGLGEHRTLDLFLEKPLVLSYSGLMEQRVDWLQKLSSFFESVDRNPVRNTITLSYTKSELTPAPFSVKEANVVEKENSRLKGELAKNIVAMKEQSEMIEHLQRELDFTNSEVKTNGKGLNLRVTSLVRKLFGIQRKH